MQPHQNQGVEKRFILSIAITVIILIAEVVGGLWTHSLALLSDSAHVFMDIFALGLSYLALRLSALPPDERHTYGYHRLEVLSALANGLTLGVIAIGIFIEAYRRFLSPEPIKSTEMMIIAVIGLVANLAVAFVLGGHDHPHEDDQPCEKDQPEPVKPGRDLNVESAFLHVLGDAISSVGVILAALIIWRTGWQVVDPIMSAVIGVIIMVSSVRVLKSSLHILVEGTPDGLSVRKISDAIQAIPGVIGIHDLHVWNICSGHVALSAHVVLTEAASHASESTMTALKTCISSHFGIDHTTIQFECVACGDDRAICQAVCK